MIGKATHREILALAHIDLLKPASKMISLQEDGHYDHVPHCGIIIRLLDVWRLINVIPKFVWMQGNSVELTREFHVNSFEDKETYQAVY